MSIHPADIVDRRAEVHPDAEIGPHAVIEGEVKIGPGTRVYPNAFISSWVEIGENCSIHPGAVLGHLPQDFHFDPATRTFLKIGNGVTVREFASVHRGTQPESTTEIGDNCFLLGYSHVGHNCVLAEGVKLYNQASLSGHVEVGRNAVVSGLTGVHQFVRIGEGVMIGAGSLLPMDIPPFMMVIGRGECVGINLIGLRRSGRDADTIHKLKDAYRLLYRSGKPFSKALDELAKAADCPETRRIVEFCRQDSVRGITGGPAGRHRE